MWAPQPAQVGLEQVEQVTRRHMPDRIISAESKISYLSVQIRFG